ncbi:MAG: hypothetical protein DHS20C15_13440 [Planctomycetota bacterium]|nr:MAG: hypothetical protein DHS20C15_13440 [Planctomycetota bacterium]
MHPAPAWKVSMRILLCLGAGLALAPAMQAQLTDLQPGRNFPTAQISFGGGRSENVDIGDVDNDGDYDVGIANGGDGSAEANVIYMNNGGAQGGTVGTFANQTSTRWAGVPNDTSRDIEFVDFENDGDLDVYISNRGTTVNNGEVSRTYENQGGKQHGAVGFYNENTNRFWGTLISVPANEEFGTQDGKGPWKDFSCDCDFGDVDDDGDVDLFHSSYGPNIAGNRDSRLFLNDGNGLFNEHWPWIEAGADIRLHTLDIDLADFDGDDDLDVFASSRDSQARVYRNNTYTTTGASAMFTDVTQSALLDTGAALSGGSNYEAEFADLDGDGDFDVWAKNYGNGTLDVTLENDGNMVFTKANWIRNDPNVDENEVDFLDFDNDGDLDVFAANFSGTNWIYTSGVAQGLTPAQGYFHRNDVGGGMASWPEAPSGNPNGGTTLDGECADMDNDGDTDLLLANDGGQQNRYWENVLGVPDTFAPTFERFTVQADKVDGSDTVIHAHVRDNTNYYIVQFYETNLIYTVDGGQERCVRMLSQSGQQFRGVIPGGLTGEIAYRIETEDDNGNASVSSTVTYNQVGSGGDLYHSISCGTEGDTGVPVLEGRGAMTPGSANSFVLKNAAPNAFAAMFLSVSSTPVLFKQGTLHTFPINVMLNRGTDAGGLDYLAFPFPGTTSLPSGTPMYVQYAVQDASHPAGATLSNAVLGTVP